MLPTTWTPEAARAGITKEQVDQANDRAAQAAQAGYQRDVAEAQSLRATAHQLGQTPNLSGQAVAALQNALAWPLDPPHVAEAVRQLRAAVEWGNRDRDLVGMTPAAPSQRATAEPVRPKPLTDAQRLDRIEKHLGLS